MNRLAVLLGMMFVIVWAAVAGIAVGRPASTTTVSDIPAASEPPRRAREASDVTVPVAPVATTTTTRPPSASFPVTGDQVGTPYSENVDGLVTFRGNPTRTD